MGFSSSGCRVAVLWAGAGGSSLGLQQIVWLQKRSDHSFPECENLGLTGGLGEADAYCEFPELLSRC